MSIDTLFPQSADRPLASRVLVVANRTAATPALLEAVRDRARRGPASFHLVVPATPRGLHRVVDPEVAGREEAGANLQAALPKLSAAVGRPVTGAVGDANPVAAIEDAMHLQGFDEIIVSTLPRRLSRWMRMDLPSKVRGLGVDVTHVAPDARRPHRTERSERRAHPPAAEGRFAASGSAR